MNPKLLFTIALAFIGLSANAQWKQIGGGTYVNSLCIDGTTIYVGTPNGMFYTPNNGVKWVATNLNSGWPNIYENVYSLAKSGDGTQLIVGTDSRLYFSGKNFNGYYGDSWTNPYYAGLPNDAKVFSLATSGSYIFVGTQYGVYTTTNYGTTWLHGNGFISPTINVMALVISGANIFAGTQYGVYLSSDNGNNWTSVNNGIPQLVIYSLAVSGTNIFAGTMHGVFLSTNNGGLWAAVNNGFSTTLLDTIISSLTINGSTVFAGGNNGVFYSTNNGAKWNNFNSGFSGWPDIRALAICGTNLLAGDANSNQNYMGTWIRPISDVFTSVNETSNGNVQVSISPNPNNGDFCINSDCKISDIQIINPLGERIYSEKIYSNKTEIDLSNQSNGIYFIHVTSEKGIAVRKVVIDK